MFKKLLKYFSDNSFLEKDLIVNQHRYAFNEWSEWFAWYPVIHNDELYWFRRIYRRSVFIKVIDITTHQYTTLMEFLAQS